MPTVDEVRALLRDVPSRWQSLELVHTSRIDSVDAWITHGNLRVRRHVDGSVHEFHGATPTSWPVRPIEPIWQTYAWAAMLDPYELSEHVTLTDPVEDTVGGRPVWRFRAYAEEGYEPICSCCSLVLSEVTQRYEYGEDWVPRPGEELPDGVEITLDVATGIVVGCHPVGGTFRYDFDNRIITAT